MHPLLRGDLGFVWDPRQKWPGLPRLYIHNLTSKGSFIDKPIDQPRETNVCVAVVAVALAETSRASCQQSDGGSESDSRYLTVCVPDLYLCSVSREVPHAQHNVLKGDWLHRRHQHHRWIESNKRIKFHSLLLTDRARLADEWSWNSNISLPNFSSADSIRGGIDAALWKWVKLFQFQTLYCLGL